MKILKAFSIVFSIIVVFFCGIAGAKMNPSDTLLKPMADPSVIDIKTSEAEKFTYRAVVSRNDNAYSLVLEKFLRGKVTEGLGQIIESLKVQDLIGGNKVKLDKGWYITDLSWNATGLQFKNQMASGSLITSVACEIKVFDKTLSVICK